MGPLLADTVGTNMALAFVVGLTYVIRVFIPITNYAVGAKSITTALRAWALLVGGTLFNAIRYCITLVVNTAFGQAFKAIVAVVMKHLASIQAYRWMDTAMGAAAKG